MPTIKFPLQPLLDVVEKTKGLPKTPTTDDLFDSDCWENGTPLDKEGKSEKDAGDGMFWPDASRINKSKLIDSFSLVGDEGVYMIPNRKVEGSPKDAGVVVYAKGCNPDVDEDYYENKRALFGGDDGAVRIPTEWLHMAKQNNNNELTIKLSANAVALVSKPVGNRPKTLKPGMKFTLFDIPFELIEKAQTRGAWRAKELNENKVYKVNGPQLKQAMFDL